MVDRHRQMEEGKEGGRKGEGERRGGGERETVGIRGREGWASEMAQWE